MRYEIHETDRNVNGYGRCWYCGHSCVDGAIYAVTGGAFYDGPCDIVVCNSDACCAAVAGGSLDPLVDAD
jgi:hypothetical protein